MGTRRRYVFVLLFVLGLVAASALVIANTSTKLGLEAITRCSIRAIGESPSDYY